MEETNRGPIKTSNNSGEEQPYLSLEEIYTSPGRVKLFVINKERTRLKDILTNDIKDLEDELCLLEILLGKISCGIDDKLIDDFRNTFKIRRQAGINPTNPYDFQFAKDRKNLYGLSLFKKLQQLETASSEYVDF